MVEELASNNRLAGGVDFHSYGQMILTQPGFTYRNYSIDDVPEELYQEMLTLGTAMQVRRRLRPRVCVTILVSQFTSPCVTMGFQPRPPPDD
jgi:hypothetical protein